MVFGFDAFGEECGSGAGGFGGHRGEDLDGSGVGGGVGEAQVELDDLGAQERQQRQAGRGGTNIVQGDPPPLGPGPLDCAEQPGDVAGEVSFGELDHDRQPAGRRQGRGGAGRWRGVERGGFDVDEQLQCRGEVGLNRPVERRYPARPVQLAQRALGAGGSEQRVRGVKVGALGPAGQCLVADDRPGLQMDHGLIQRVDLRPGWPRARPRRGCTASVGAAPAESG